MIEYPLPICCILASCITDVITEVEDNDRPGSIDGIKSLGEGGSRKENKGDNKSTHDNERIREDIHTSFFESNKIVLILNSFLFMDVVLG